MTRLQVQLIRPAIPMLGSPMGKSCCLMTFVIGRNFAVFLGQMYLEALSLIFTGPLLYVSQRFHE